MDTEVIITSFKVAGVVIGGVLGVVGVLFNFKNPSGHITVPGKFVIAGIVLSAVVGIITSVTEGINARREAVKQATKTEQVLKELSRAIQPITELRITYFITLPSKSPLVRSYLQKLSRELESKLPGLEEDSPIRPDPDLHVTSRDADGAITIDISQKSKFWPRKDDGVIGLFAAIFNFSIHLRRTPIETENFDSVHSVDAGQSDWIAMGLPFSGHNTLNYKPKTKALEIHGRAEYDKELWASNGKITSVEDLLGAQLFLIPPSALNTKYRKPDAKLDRTSSLMKDLSGTIVVNAVALTFAAGRVIWIDGKALKKSRFKYGYPAFSIILPDNEKSFEKIRPRD